MLVSFVFQDRNESILQALIAVITCYEFVSSAVVELEKVVLHLGFWKMNSQRYATIKI